MKRIFPLTCVLLFAFCSSANANLVSGVIVGLSNPSNSATPAFGTAVGNTLSDPFAYDLTNPNSVNPAQAFSAGNTFHADEPVPAGATTVDVVFDYDVNHVVTAPNDNVVLDVWGRLGSGNSLDRDDTFIAELLDTAGNAIATVNSGITDNATQFVRVDFGAIGTGTLISGLRITGIDSEAASANNNFTLQEVRLAAGAVEAVPEPTSAVILGLGVIGLATRRRRR